MGFTAAGISPTTVTTTQQAPLGFELTVPDGDNGLQEWVYVFNDEASTAFAIGNVIIKDPSATTFDFYGGIQAPDTAHTPAVMVLGVAQHPIAAGSYGFILRKGVGLVLAGSAGVAVDSAFTTGGSAAGTVLVYADDTAGANIAVIGHTATAISGGATGTVYVNCG
tara:strand:+ start:2012 stop:2509 length:498 start_codon:yes stop_codon:yes gene_type:complete